MKKVLEIEIFFGIMVSFLKNPDRSRMISWVLQTTFTLTLAFLLYAQPAIAFSQKSIPAKACIVIDDNDSILYAKNPSAKLPPASTVKLVTAMVALDRLDPEAKVQVSRYAVATRSIRPRLVTGDELTVSDLLHLALMKSINSAAVALAEEAAGSEDAFVELMNQKALEIGALDTHFVTASGLPKGRQYTTARDLVIILKKALTYPLIKDIIGKKEWVITTSAGRELYVENTDSLLWTSSNIIGGKTGFTASARHCFVGAMGTEKGLIFTVVLGSPSRNRLWQSTLMLEEVGNNPELVNSLEEQPAKKRVRHKRKARKD
jgi:D-alanyl-D-alanine carboxypeptidase (penicillin-binding protein 5/6)